jgi:hypothetical protein
MHIDPTTQIFSETEYGSTPSKNGLDWFRVYSTGGTRDAGLVAHGGVEGRTPGPRPGDSVLDSE